MLPDGYHRGFVISSKFKVRGGLQTGNIAYCFCYLATRDIIERVNLVVVSFLLINEKECEQVAPD